MSADRHCRSFRNTPCAPPVTTRRTSAPCLSSPAEGWRGLEFYGLGDDEVNQLEARLDAVTPEIARQVIQKNLKTVQQIAYLLGENAADSEIILNSIVRSFSPEDVEDSSD